MMRWVNWAREFEPGRKQADIPSRVRQLEVLFWGGLLLSVALMLGGVLMMLQAAPGDSRSQFLGLFLALEGFGQMWGIIIVAGIRYALYESLWERQSRTEDELRRSLAEDL